VISGSAVGIRSMKISETVPALKSCISFFHVRRLATPLQQSVSTTPGAFDKDRPLKLLGILCEYTQTNSV